MDPLAPAGAAIPATGVAPWPYGGRYARGPWARALRPTLPRRAPRRRALQVRPPARRPAVPGPRAARRAGGEVYPAKRAVRRPRGGKRAAAAMMGPRGPMAVAGRATAGPRHRSRARVEST